MSTNWNRISLSMYGQESQDSNSHLPLDVVLQHVLVHSVKVTAAHVVIVVGRCVAELLTVGPVFQIIGLVAVVVVKVALTEQKNVT